MFRIIAMTTLAFSLLSLVSAQAEDRPTLEIAWPAAASVIELGNDSEKAIGVVVRSNFTLLSAGECGDNSQCGHVHMKIDPDGDTCNIPGKPYNSMNSDFGGDLIEARFGHCPVVVGKHVIGVLIADDRHKPILVDGKPVTALVTVTTK
ncbi:hypothetical protein GCM10010869_52200 [Mesorhizobium tianshanense]|uniref:Uncharacterized protein n=1 Tax=Mesorhizobium tianshanense TaxID=39844 RepID=A0A562PFL4_9HYPH|nr:hypothetical protein [Mesorhizobium tianshanense]TWI43123.1 hypothetical protein IQ26_00084 [Mesorhizobium tianshanense]GLS39623.1 hypothetical protein GCM10010869_52200 [Mesorhizobium tianshanense]